MQMPATLLLVEMVQTLQLLEQFQTSQLLCSTKETTEFWLVVTLLKLPLHLTKT